MYLRHVVLLKYIFIRHKSKINAYTYNNYAVVYTFSPVFLHLYAAVYKHSAWAVFFVHSNY